MGLKHWLQLALTEGIGPILQSRLIDACGDIESACGASTTTLRNIDGIGNAKAQQIRDALKRAADQVDDEIKKAREFGASPICRDDENYPALLKEIPDPPAVLYVMGDFQPRDLHSVAIVGSRKCSFYGREQAERFGALLAGAAITVISGGARGIDSAAHRGALSHQSGRTIAVLGSGVDVPYPPENAELFMQIARRGAVVSEYPMGTPPLAENFPRRNRIVSGLSRGVLVIEADERSGALITARQACDDHGRTVFALPGRVDNKLSVGPHKLIRDGATLVGSLEDILEELGPMPQSVSDVDSVESASPVAPTNLTEEQSTILNSLDGESLDADAIIERTSVPAHIVLQHLTMLSLRGLVKRDGKSVYTTMNARSDMITVFVIRPSEGGSSHEFLQLRRAADDYMGGTWQIVRGRVEDGESYLDAALRELREEAGVAPDELYRLGQVESFYTDVDDTLWHSVAFCAIVHRDRSITLNEEHDDFRWVGRDEIEAKTMWASEKTLLKETLTEILDDGPAKAYLRVALGPQ